MKKYAVAGSPIAHSESPEIFKKLFKMHNLNNSAYTRVYAETAEEALWLFNEIELNGMNITAPLKKEILPLINQKSPEVEKIGAANVLKRENNSLKLYNTDWVAVKEIIENLGEQHNNIILLGAGGAASAALYGILKSKLSKSKVYILNKTLENAKKLKLKYTELDIYISNDNNREFLSESAIIISTLPKTQDYFDGRIIGQKDYFIDAAYPNTKLIENALSRGLYISDGRLWLTIQAIHSYELFNNIKINYKYSDISNYYNIKSKKRDNIALIGFMGSGKTTLGKILANEIGYAFIDIDEEIEKREITTIHNIFMDINKGEKYFRNIETEILKEYSENDRIIISCGGGIASNETNDKILNKIGKVVWLYSKLDTCKKRVFEANRFDNCRPMMKIFDSTKRIKLLFDYRKDGLIKNSSIIINNEGSIENIINKLKREMFNI